MEFKSFILECESKMYSISKIKFYSSPYYVGHVIPEHLNKNFLSPYYKMYSFMDSFNGLCMQKKITTSY